jgi:hypothetical protein
VILFEGISLSLDALKRAVIERKNLTASGADLVVMDTDLNGACSSEAPHKRRGCMHAQGTRLVHGSVAGPARGHKPRRALHHTNSKNIAARRGTPPRALSTRALSHRSPLSLSAQSTRTAPSCPRAPPSSSRSGRRTSGALSPAGPRPSPAWEEEARLGACSLLSSERVCRCCCCCCCCLACCCFRCLCRCLCSGDVLYVGGGLMVMHVCQV